MNLSDDGELLSPALSDFLPSLNGRPLYEPAYSCELARVWAGRTGVLQAGDVSCNS